MLLRTALVVRRAFGRVKVSVLIFHWYWLATVLQSQRRSRNAHFTDRHSALHTWSCGVCRDICRQKWRTVVWLCRSSWFADLLHTPFWHYANVCHIQMLYTQARVRHLKRVTQLSSANPRDALHHGKIFKQSHDYNYAHLGGGMSSTQRLVWSLEWSTCGIAWSTVSSASEESVWRRRVLLLCIDG